MPVLELLHHPKDSEANGLTPCLDHPKEALIRCSDCGWVPIKECPSEDMTVLGRTIKAQVHHSCGGNIIYMTTGGPQYWYFRDGQQEN